jgi:DNA-binding response OmpR family regulator
MTALSVNKARILLVDDERDITGLLEEALRKDGFKEILKASTGQQAIQFCKKCQPDVIILDIMLPDIDGIEVCKKIREFSYCPILFLSSRDDEIDKILGLSSGGDDYVSKPFSPREIVFRIKAQLRRQQFQFRQQTDEKQSLVFGNLKIDTDGCRVYKSGRELVFTAREFELLRCLAENANKIISKERLYELVWGEDSAGCENTIMVHIRHIREKIEDDPAHPQLLQTVKGLGYRLVQRNCQ